MPDALIQVNTLIITPSSPSYTVEDLSLLLKMPTKGYHSVYHALNVSAIAGELALLEETEDYNNIVTAALFHDAGHSCNSLVPDHRNLLAAVTHWQNYYVENYSHLSEIVEVQKVSELILATHSGTSPNKNYSESEKIIYDADTLSNMWYLRNNAVEQMREDILMENFQEKIFEPLEFIKFRGIHSEAGKTYVAREIPQLFE